MTAPKLMADGPTRGRDLCSATFGIYGTLRFFAICLVVLCAVFLLFLLFPGLDLAASSLFYGAKSCGNINQCGGFPAADNPTFKLLRLALYVLPYVVLVGAMLYKIVVFLKNRISFWQDTRVVSVLLATLVIGPGLLVNTILKSYIGRVRPRDITDFGGDFPFVPVGQIEGMCQLNCSFVSGEAAIAPIVILSILLFPKPLQRPAFFILLPASLAMALLRVVLGAHFTSDVILGYVLTLTVFSALALVSGRLNLSRHAIGR